MFGNLGIRFQSTGKYNSNGMKWGQEDFSLPIQTLPTFWATWIWLLRTFIFEICWVYNFPNPGSQISKSGLGQAWAGPGLGLGPGGTSGVQSAQQIVFHASEI